MHSKRRTALVVLGVLVAVPLAGCGSDDASSDADLAVSASEFAFTPTSWTVTAGEPFTVEFSNDGTEEHEWVVVKLGDDLASEADFAEEKVLFEIEKTTPGTTTTQTFTVPDAGTYQVVCGLTGHFDAGMKGTLTAS